MESYAVEHNAPTAVFQKTDLGPTESLYLQFAQFQLAMAAQARSGAENRLQAIRDTQDEQKEVSAMLQQARKLQMQAKNGTGDCTWDDHASVMPKEMKEFMDNHKLTYDTYGEDSVHNENEWKIAIESLTDYQENLGMDTQQQMVYIQDFMGQYNSYLQGANTQISNSNQTLTSLARGQ